MLLACVDVSTFFIYAEALIITFTFRYMDGALPINNPHVTHLVS